MAPKITRIGSIFRAILILLITFLGIYSNAVQAQSFKSMKYIGLEASFGVRSFKVNSNIARIDGMKAGHEGGSLAVVFGNDLLMTKLRAAGFYYSNANTPQTQQLFETSAMVNFYPTELLRNGSAKLRPYVTTGLSMDKVKFFGYYLDAAGSSAYEPYLGNVSHWGLQGGLGIEYSIHNACDFIHIFAEATMVAPLQSTKTSPFKNTSISKFTSVSVGVSFGMNKNQKKV